VNAAIAEEVSKHNLAKIKRAHVPVCRGRRGRVRGQDSKPVIIDSNLSQRRMVNVNRVSRCHFFLAGSIVRQLAKQGCWRRTVSLFYFHLSAPDGCFPDELGCDLQDLAAAHVRGLKLMQRISRIRDLAGSTEEPGPWTVSIEDEHHQTRLVVLFPSELFRSEEPQNPVHRSLRLLARA
jgi:hypothetical protein